MCGISGFIGKNDLSQETIKKTLTKMKYTGPDVQDFKNFKTQDLNIYLLFSRLSIIDLSKNSDQPMTKSGNTIVFNGEIYNYLEIKKELEAKGEKFNSKGDAEVALSAYNFYGKKCFEKFNGIWSIAIWDNKNKKLVLSNDRLSEKPLFYLKNSYGVYFGSETNFIRSLDDNTSSKKNLNKIRDFLYYGSRSIYMNYDTFYDNIFKVPGGSVLEIDHNLKISKEIYWNLNYKVLNKNISEKEIFHDVKSLLVDSTRLRMQSDVPIAFSLSGGIDSGSVASIAVKELNKKIFTYSIIDRMSSNYNEEEQIKSVTKDLNCENIELNLSGKDFFDDLLKVINYHDKPIGTITGLIQNLLAKEISKDSIKVVLTGTGSDEVFTGYYFHYLAHLKSLKINKSVLFEENLDYFKKHIHPFIRNPKYKAYNEYLNQNIKEMILSNDGLDLIEKDFFKRDKKLIVSSRPIIDYNTDPLTSLLLNDVHIGSLKHILTEEDLNFMNHSIENRSPYMEYRLVEYLFNTDYSIKIQKGYAKYLLRESMNGILYDKVRLNREKKGFNASLGSVFNLKSKKIKELIFQKTEIFNFVEKNKIEKLLNKDQFDNEEKKLIFCILSSQAFLNLNS